MAARPTSGRSSRPVSAGRPQSRRGSRASRTQLKTTLELNPDELDPYAVDLKAYDHRKYTAKELRQAHGFYRKLAPHGFLDKYTFNRSMHKLCPYVSHDLRDLLRHFLDKTGDAQIDEAEFVVAGWGFFDQVLSLLDNEANGHVLDDMPHNLSEEIIVQLIPVHEGYVSDKKLSCFKEDMFSHAMERLLSFSHKQSSAMLDMLVGAETADPWPLKLTFKDFIKAVMFFHDGNGVAVAHGDEVHAQREMTAAQMREAKAIYKSFDTNRDGVIDSEEMHNRMSDFGWTDVEIMKMVGDMDTDNDGKICLEEWMAVYIDFF